MAASYNDLHIRDYKEDDGSKHLYEHYWSSPDIITYGQEILEMEKAQSGYTGDYQGKPIQNGCLNNCYVRVKNLGNTTTSGNVRLYYIDASLLNIPSKWVPIKGVVGVGPHGVPNYSEVLDIVTDCKDDENERNDYDNNNKKIGSQKIGINATAFLMDTKLETSKDRHYCLIALIDTPTHPMTMEHIKEDMTNEEYAIWVRTQPNVAQYNISLVEPEKKQMRYYLGFGNQAPIKRTFYINVEFYSFETEPEGRWPVGNKVTMQCTDSYYPFTKNSTIPHPDNEGRQIITFGLQGVPAWFYSSLNVVIDDIESFNGGVKVSYDLEFYKSDVVDQRIMDYAWGKPPEKVGGEIPYYITMGTCYAIVGDVLKSEWRSMLRLDKINPETMVRE